jgi:CubicO group peptidase (beta-lactamase class C family)
MRFRVSPLQFGPAGKNTSRATVSPTSNHPAPVDGDTVFRIGSTTKTFTGTTMMRLVEQGKVDLDAPVRHYIPDFAVADPSVSADVTVRQLLNHTSGWNGDDVQDFGRGDDALARYVSSMKQLPQLTPRGSVFAYNNSGLVAAGRIIELVNGTTYEAAVQSLLLDPLQLSRTHYFSDQIIGLNIAGGARRGRRQTGCRHGFLVLSAQLQPHRRVDVHGARSIALHTVSPR